MASFITTNRRVARKQPKCRHLISFLEILDNSGTWSRDDYHVEFWCFCPETVPYTPNGFFIAQITSNQFCGPVQHSCDTDKGNSDRKPTKMVGRAHVSGAKNKLAWKTCFGSCHLCSCSCCLLRIPFPSRQRNLMTLRSCAEADPGFWSGKWGQRSFDAKGALRPICCSKQGFFP